MNRPAAVPPACARFFFPNAGGPLRRAVGREAVGKTRKWQLVTLDCGHRILVPHYRQAGRYGCGFCGGLQPAGGQPLG
jgi:hypothetical protein